MAKSLVRRITTFRYPQTDGFQVRIHYKKFNDFLRDITGRICYNWDERTLPKSRREYNAEQADRNTPINDYSDSRFLGLEQYQIPQW